MRKFSRYAFTSMAALTLLSTLSPAALAIDSKINQLILILNLR
ncbi:Zinc metalloproteinase aureolysin [Staphylococcus aureus]|nr:Zinc metalloproteinase aureolysin [Staphylococcus aureus]